MHEGVNEQIPFVSYPRRFGKIGLSLFVFVQGFLPCRVFFFGLSLGLHTPPFLRVISYSTRPDAMCTLFCRRDMLHAVFLTDDDLEEELEKRQGHGVRCALPQVVFFFFLRRSPLLYTCPADNCPWLRCGARGGCHGERPK